MDDKTVTNWPLPRLAAHALLPGLASLAVFLPVALLLQDTGIPIMAALFIGILLGEVPVSWWLMIRGVRREGGELSADALFPWRTSPGRLRLVFLGIPLAIGGMIIVFGLASALEPAIREALFGWVPGSLVLEAGPEGMMEASRAGVITLWILSGVVGVGIGGVTQELYHRGFLLPRTAHIGAWAVPFNAGAFAVMHLAAPWGWPFFFLAALLWGAAVYRWRSVQLGLAGHIGMLALGWVFMTLAVLGVLPMPN